ncbi:MAG: endopeptidase La [Bacteroidaceae bacterium]|nr:endopeptidase La [Bacteroidaceae bacterium]
MSTENNPINPFTFITEYDGDEAQLFKNELPPLLQVLPLRDLVLFPGIVVPISIGRSESLVLVKNAVEKNKFIAVATQRNAEVESPQGKDLYDYGVVARILRIYESGNGTLTAIVHGLNPIRFTSVQRISTALMAHYELCPIILEDLTDKTFVILRETLRDRLLEYIQLNDELADDAVNNINSIYHFKFFVNYVCTNLPFDIEQKIAMLAQFNPKQRATSLMRLLAKEIQLLHISDDIKRQTKADIDKQQRDYFLQQQLHNIQEQLGSTAQNDADKFRQKAEKMRWSDDVKETFNHELEKMERLNPQSPDYQVQYNYLETLLQLPWGVFTADNLSLSNAEKVLNKNHYGMKDVKERILEHLAVRQMKAGNVRSTIICLYGPPGVGKTSLCRSIASAMKRKYVRASLGGLHDEAEIRGHRRTYIGAMPGRIVKSLIKAGTSNPVFVLDEIDKITESTHNGDPSSALLEVLDPEQNATFHDNFLEVDIDLSKVMFIATANNVGAIPRPLLDRMELIEVNGYITEEKAEIARRHLEPRVKENCGIADRKDIKFTKRALDFLIERYTRESGVRGLEKELDRYYRRAILQYERNGSFPATKIEPADVEALLGKPKFTRDTYQGNEFAGVVTGLAWTSVGGEILFIESSLSRGKGQKLTLTGNLGDVMKESAVLALEFIKAHADLLNIDERIFQNYNIHIHVPEGAVPKDGPSAGITMTTSLVSVLTQRRVRQNIAMTGEITLRGKVLPVGGIKEKILAAKRAGITDIILCCDNQKDIEEIDAIYLHGLKFHYVNTVMEVLDFALLQEQVPHPLQFRFDEEKEKE